jgi:hypothetical protein
MGIEDFVSNVKGTGLNHDEQKWRDNSRIFRGGISEFTYRSFRYFFRVSVLEYPQNEVLYKKYIHLNSSC